MNITLNGDLVPDLRFLQSIKNNETEAFCKHFVYKNSLDSNKLDLIAHDFGDKFQFHMNGFVMTTALSYSNHIPLAIAPRDLWFIFQTQLALIVNTFPETFRSLFSTSADKKEISIMTDDITKIDINKLMLVLRENIPTYINHFTPKFSYEDKLGDLAIAASFCDMVSPYYDYGTVMCGIPAIQLKGQWQDWDEIANKASLIATVFKTVKDIDPKIINYLETINSIFLQISLSYRFDSVDFWKNIFTRRNVGSGGQLEINGWILDLFFDMRTPNGFCRIEEFNNNIAKVNYKNLETGRNFSAFYGIFSASLTDGWLENHFGNLVFERT